MKLRISLFGSLLFASMLFGQAVQDMHSPQSFMPPLEGWKVVGQKPFMIHDKGFLKDRAIKGVEWQELKGPNGRGGALLASKGVIIIRFAEIAKEGHPHAALLTENGNWVFGEGDTFEWISTDHGIQFCLDDYSAKKRACGVEISFTPRSELKR